MRYQKNLKCKKLKLYFKSRKPIMYSSFHQECYNWPSFWKMADDFYTSDLIFLQLGKFTHLNCSIKLIINEFPMLAHLKYPSCMDFDLFLKFSPFIERKCLPVRSNILCVPTVGIIKTARESAKLMNENTVARYFKVSQAYLICV